MCALKGAPTQFYMFYKASQKSSRHEFGVHTGRRAMQVGLAAWALYPFMFLPCAQQACKFGWPNFGPTLRMAWCQACRTQTCPWTSTQHRPQRLKLGCLTLSDRDPLLKRLKGSANSPKVLQGSKGLSLAKRALWSRVLALCWSCSSSLCKMADSRTEASHTTHTHTRKCVYIYICMLCVHAHTAALWPFFPSHAVTT